MTRNRQVQHPADAARCSPRYRHALLCLGLILLPVLARAEADSSAGDAEQYERNRSHYYAAIGTAVVPDYEGSAYYEVLPLVIARWIKRGAYAELVGARLRINVIPESLWQFGPVLRWNRGRGDVDSIPVRRMEHIDGTLEAGGFFGPLLRDPDDPRRQLGLQVELLQDLGRVHKGYYLTLELNAGTPLGEKWAINLALNSTYGSRNYMSTYFGVNARDALRSGLPAYSLSGGFGDVAFSANLSYALGDHWGLALGGRYQRLIGAAGRSPVVAQAGSRDQFIATLMATYLY